MNDRPLVFLKLGGSLITEKDRPHTYRPAVLTRLADEITAAWAGKTAFRLLLGHGSGSYGHVPAKQHRTRAGVHTPQGWAGFLEVWRQARALHDHVLKALQEAGLPAISLPPSAILVAHDGVISSWDLTPLQAAMEARLLPVVYGDVVFDTERGGTILSTEDLFTYLARRLHPRRILLAGLEAGVWVDYPHNTRLLERLTPGEVGAYIASLGESAATDVTGGMASKVRQSLELVSEIPGLEVLIFSGDTPGAVQQALCGARLGTTILGD